MRKFKRLYIIKIIIIMSVMSFIISACSQNPGNPTPQQQGTNEQMKDEKIPELLKTIESDIENMFKELKGPAVILDDEKEDEQEENGQQGEQKEQGGEQEKQGEEKEKNNQDQSKDANPNHGQSEQKQQKPDDPWQKVSSLVNSLHFKWNGYMPEAGKKGSNKTLLDNFGNSLNKLTSIITKKDTTESLLALNELYSYIPDFYSLYKTGISPEIKRIRHFTREIILYSKTGEWSRVETAFTNLKSSWSLFKNTLDKEYETTSGKLDYSIYELEKVIGEKEQNLTDIKGKVTLANIQNLEKDQLKKSEMEQFR